ncbi:hypothetical protein AABB24_018774 [Solanum stoloniferum]|uniref:Uncharacterized protein n=1 Tax=Solanum stoloniferum TaxID=62892 RepID=A0ABD2TD93_9SOLN
MVGALSVVGSPMVDSHSSPCLCLDALPTCNLGIGDSLARKQKQLPRLGTMELSTSFVDLRFSAKCVEGNYKNLKKQTKGRKNLRIVNDLGGQYEENFSDIKTEKQELAEKVMATRLSLYAKWIKKCDHKEIYNRISDQNVEVMRERLMETVIWPSDDTNTGMK